MASESKAVIERREVLKESVGTLQEWMADEYTGLWADGRQRKLILHAVDYENGYLIVEPATVEETGLGRTEDRIKVTVTVERARRG